MKRMIIKQLEQWKANESRMPLILKGVRQCGKTYLLKDFGREYFPRFHYFNFEQDNRLAMIFNDSLDPRQILFELSLHINTEINFQTDLIIFDEIQACPRALTSLKYFCEEMPEAFICAAGSLLGLHLNSGSFPVGKVEFLHLHPMSFEEFLLATGHEKIFDFIISYSFEDDIPESIHLSLWELLKIYFVVGGMPDVINIYQKNKENLYTAFEKVRERQNDLIVAYQADIAKHSGKVNAMHIDRIWRDVPSQLARAQDGNSKKFKFKGILPGIDRYQRLAEPIDWLCAAELVIKVPIVETARFPLPSHVKDNRFKLYMNDVGLLGAMSELPVNVLLDQDYGSYKGYFAENYVAQAFLSAGCNTLYCWEDNRSEVEFLRVIQNNIIPIEVKSGHVTKAQSLQKFYEKYQPPYQIILSAKPPLLAKGLTRYYPLYLAGKL